MIDEWDDYESILFYLFMIEVIINGIFGEHKGIYGQEYISNNIRPAPVTLGLYGITLGL